MTAPVYIIGHKNPDADAVCSAIAYAALKNATDPEHKYVPARCGNSNARIDAILRRFNVPLPLFLGDATPRVQDILREKVIKTHIKATCSDALRLIDEHDVRAIPVLGEHNKLEGLISIFHLGAFFTPKPSDPLKMRHVSSRICDIVRVLNAKELVLHEPEKLEDLYVRVGAMDLRSFGRFTEKEGVSAAQSIIVVGDRYDIQQKAIQAGSRLVIITGNLDLDEDVVNMAKEREVSLIVSPYDSATTSWMVRSATQLAPMIDRKVVTFDRDEKLASVRRKIAQSYSPLYCVVDSEQHLLGVFSKTDLLKPVQRRLILVDHNELNQAVTGASECEILEIIDHHRLGNPPTAQPIRFRNDVIGSTSSLVASMFRESGLVPEPDIAGIMMAGLISDTLNLQGPTTTPKDAQLLPWLAELAGCEVPEIADLIFKSGSIILSSEPLDIIKSDCKHYAQGDLSYSVSQVEELGFSNFWQRSRELLEALETYRTKEGHAFSVLLVTDVNKQNSLLLVRGDEDVLESISYAHVDNPCTFDMPGIVSRKKQVIPYFTQLLNGLGHSSS